ncbi:hypothetical protein PCE1_000946 [Barthelona sp. PCE]
MHQNINYTSAKISPLTPIVGLCCAFSFVVSLVATMGWNPTVNLENGLLLATFSSVFLMLPLFIGYMRIKKSGVPMEKSAFWLDICMGVPLVIGNWIFITPAPLFLTFIIGMIVKCVTKTKRHACNNLTLAEAQEMMNSLIVDPVTIQTGYFVDNARNPDGSIDPKYITGLEDFIFDLQIDNTDKSQDFTIPLTADLCQIKVIVDAQPADQYTANLEKYIVKLTRTRHGRAFRHMEWGSVASLSSIQLNREFLVKVRNGGCINTLWYSIVLIAPVQVWYTSFINSASSHMTVTVSKLYQCVKGGHTSVEHKNDKGFECNGLIGEPIAVVPEYTPVASNALNIGQPITSSTVVNIEQPINSYPSSGGTASPFH